ncbi:uncharacterized protein B0J16DRAFT_400471 [Fusarium flagelliforme]|uniref:uncharacterized protein n=1 Tax=Fusarium flagelliforme TaxID=2675880 RepID=UPI001E8D207A|nr:uncharacterized protein B0J16DRAFT_400471 [Fusarium flagelliforme]KAH7182287.1 hypothetical protein B0J16DRAFT_400471 [Fusarium flagelliforme]
MIQVHRTCRQCLHRSASLEDYRMHFQSHETTSHVDDIPSRAIDAAIQKIVSMSKGTISATQTLAILTDVIYKTGGIVPVMKAATGGIPTPIKEQVATAPVTSAPVHIKAEAREPPVARTPNNFTKTGATLPNSAHGVSLARNNSDTMVTGITSRSHQSTSWFVRDKLYYETDRLKEHNANYHWPELCVACDLTFPDTKSLEEHKTTHAPEPIECLGCSKRFSSYSLMMEHLESGTCRSGATSEFIRESIKTKYKDPGGRGAPNLPLSMFFTSCHRCKEEFPHLSVLLRHYEARDCGKLGWQWYIPVGEMFYDRLKRAILAHVQCVTCNIAFKDQSTRNEHMWKEHKERYCFLSKNDFSESAWLLHLQYLQEGLHKDEKNRRWKSEPKAIPCKNCNPVAIFKSDSEYYNHCRTEHSTCVVCAVTYDSKEDLSKHDAKVHSKCGICGYLATTYLDLRPHFTEVHGIKLPRRPDTPPQNLEIVEGLPDAALNSVRATGDSFESEEPPVKMDETSRRTSPQAE